MPHFVFRMFLESSITTEVAATTFSCSFLWKTLAFLQCLSIPINSWITVTLRVIKMKEIQFLIDIFIQFTQLRMSKCSDVRQFRLAKITIKTNNVPAFWRKTKLSTIEINFPAAKAKKLTKTFSTFWILFA